MHNWRNNWRGLRSLLAYLWEHRLYSLLGLLACFVADSAQLIVPLLSKKAIDQLSLGHSTTAFLATQAGLLLLVAAIAYGSRYAWRYYMFTAARLAELDIRHRLFNRAVRLSLESQNQGRAGDIMSLATNDVMSVRMALAFGLMATFDAFGYSAMSIAAMISLDWKLALYCLAPYPLLALLMVFLMDKNYRTFDKVQTSFSDLTEKARESTAGMRVLRAYVQNADDVKDFHEGTEALYQNMMSHVRWDSLYTPAITFVSGISSALLLGIGGGHVIDGTTTVGSFTAFSAYLGQLTWPMIAAGWALAIVQRASASMSRIQDMLDREPEFGADEPPAWKVRGDIEARNLTFSYPAAEDGAPPALLDVSFTLKAGGTLGIVGEVGSGKSTLALLLQRLYDAPPDSLFIDGVDLSKLDPRQIRANISWVPQEAFLFSETIEENLRIGRDDLPRDQVLAASQSAALHDEVLEFPLGYETLLGERGVTLSGGQKQRLTLARSLLRGAPILILDDTLSAVDAHTERAILSSLRERIRERTSLIISHRISTVMESDEIIVLEAGRVVQRGTHSELIALDGMYRQLFLMQTEDEPLI